MTTLVALVLVLAAFAAAGLVWWNRRSSRLCPTCDVELVTVSAPGAGPNRTYEVVACLKCFHTATFVDGARSDTARCSRCGGDEMSVPTVRLAGVPPRVGVRESCPACHHERSFTVSAHDDDTPSGKVIAFPGPADRPRRRQQPGSDGG